ncbi:MAG: hypothetical protein WC464_01565 [Bdellovibrionales bacterium]
MRKNAYEDKILHFVPRRRFLAPSLQEIAAMSGQLSYLATCARNFGMNHVSTYCGFANEELGKWLEEHGKNPDAFRDNG